MWLLGKITDDVDSIAKEYLNHLVINYRRGIKEIVDGAEYRTPYDIVKRAIQESLKTMSLEVDSGLIEEATRLFRWLHVENSTIFPGVEEILKELQNLDVKLGVVTNSFEKHLELILSKLNLIDYFKCTVDGAVVHAFKPSPEPFQHALNCLGYGVRETLFIGDEYFADIVGATKLGIDAIWVNNRGGDLDRMIDKYSESSRPLMVVASVAELKKFI